MGALIFYSPNTGEIVGEINEIQEINMESVSINETTSPFFFGKRSRIRYGWSYHGSKSDAIYSLRETNHE